jgi:hypothetical protein
MSSGGAARAAPSVPSEAVEGDNSAPGEEQHGDSAARLPPPCAPARFLD